jgi:predicted TIM-barrel fold metal-dependent hydrolase
MHDYDIKNKVKEFIIIDSHLHLGYPGYLYMPSNTIEAMVDLLKRFGIKKAICSNHLSFFSGSFGLEELLKILKRYKDFLLGYYVYNPNFESESLDLLKKCVLQKSVAGIKIHPSWHLCYPQDKKYDKFWDFTEQNQIPVLTHSWDPEVANKAQKFSDPFLFESIIKRYPSLKLILAHAGGRGRMLYRVIDLMEEYENLYVDFAGDIFVPGLIEEYVRRVGSERLLFGTDMPWTDVRFHLASVLNLELSKEEIQNILGLNAVKLFRLEI